MSQPHKLAVIVPYRDRAEHLEAFLPHVQSYLDRQRVPFHLVIVEQEAGKPFNKGILLNAGYRAATTDCDYFVFHDVDQLPLEVNYEYDDGPTHLAAAVSQFNFRLPYEALFGGAVMFTRSAFERVNGYSNSYWGWGGEDDDMLRRCGYAGLAVQRQLPGTFQSLDHDRPRDPELYARNVHRLREMWAGRVDWRCDGLTSCRYRVLGTETTANQTWMKLSL
jgi:beta-1,4-galactosyltransferase 1